MSNMILVLSDVDGMDFGAGVVTRDEMSGYITDSSVCYGPYDAAPDYVFGPLLNNFLLKESMTCEIEGQEIDVPVCEIPVFNSNKEIKASDFFTHEQAVFVIEEMKSTVSNYYKTWNNGYRSEELELVEVSETGRGELAADLDYEGPFNKDNLFFLQADTLPFKHDSIVAVVGYINPDGSISYSSFEKEDYESDGETIEFDNEEFSWDEFEAYLS